MTVARSRSSTILLVMVAIAVAPAHADDGAVAAWILAQGGKVRVSGDSREIRSTAALPTGSFAIDGVNLTGTLTHPRDLERLRSLRLRSLTLPGTMWNPVCCGALGNVDDSDLIAAIAEMHTLEELHLSHHFMSVFKGIRIFDHAIKKLSGLGCFCCW